MPRIMFALISFATAALLAATALPARAAEEQPRTVSTNGEATVYVAPDEVVVTVGVQTFDPDLDKSKAANDERAAKLLKAVKGLGIEDKHVQTDTLQVSLQYHDGHPTHGIEGYYAHRTYTITLKDTKQFEKLIDTCLKNGANELSGFEFRTTELRKYRDQARKMAIKAAKEKATDLCGELGVTLGRPRTISEGGYGYYGGRMWGANYFGNAMAQNSVQFAPGGAAGGDEGETLPLGQIAIRASISVTFDQN